MKKLRNKMIVGALVGVIALGGLFQVGGIRSVAYASSNKYHAKAMQDFIKSHRYLFVLQKRIPNSLEPVSSIDYANLDEFKKGVVKLPQGWYLAHVGASSVIFWKK